MKNQANTIAAILNPDSVDVKENVLIATDKKVNGFDLSEDVLTYKVGDEKTFQKAVKFTGDLRVIPGSSSGDLTLSSTSDVFLVDDRGGKVSEANIHG